MKLISPKITFNVGPDGSVHLKGNIKALAGRYHVAELFKTDKSLSLSRMTLLRLERGYQYVMTCSWEDAEFIKIKKDNDESTSLVIRKSMLPVQDMISPCPTLPYRSEWVLPLL